MEIAYAVPLFFALIAIELLVSRLRREPVYRLEDSVTNLSCGIGQQMIEPFVFAIQYGVYIALQARFAIFTIDAKSPVAWLVLFLGVDMAYYWFHRTSHRVRAIWATHVVHHQSEEYNLSVALRQSWLQNVPEAVFYWPLAILGFPPKMFATVFALDVLYQFWIHTRLVGRLGPLEWVMNTPSHHRVHHGINPKYIDKNYAGVLIVWDRLFGTFQAEVEEPVYGTVKPLSSWNPLWANLEGWAEIARLARSTPRFVEKLFVWIAPPEWLPAELGGRAKIPETSRETQTRYAAHASRGVSRYVFANFVLLLGATSAVMFLGAAWPVSQKAIVTGLIVLTLVCFGALFEGRKWARPLEALRLVAVLVVVAWKVGGG
jgi:alkylglycerol monooxygenase